MGIRINKAIGYGLNDVKTDGKGIADERFSLLHDDDWWENLYESDFNEYKTFLEDEDLVVKVLTEKFAADPESAKWDYTHVRLFLNSLKERKYPPDNYDFFEYDGEARDDWILFYPHGNIKDGMFGGWRRRDDTIDYYENRVYKKELDSIITDLSEYGTRGLYPYNHGMHLKPGRENKIKEVTPKYFEINPNRPDYIEGGHYNMMVGKWDGDKMEPLVKDPEMIKHLEEDWHPIIPVTIKLFVHYFNVFKNPHTVYDLKPLLCQWWS
jgi:hypothetical protein